MGFKNRLNEMTKEQKAEELLRRADRKAERKQKWTDFMAQSEQVRKDRQLTKRRVRQDISKVGDKSSGILACPKCGGTSFKAKRSRGAKLALGATVGVGALLAHKTRVKCVTCGTEYLRG